MLRATAGDTQVTLEWTSGGDGGADIDRWEYRYSTDGTLDTETWTQITDSSPNSSPVGVNAASFTVTGLTNGAEHLFEVRAHNSAGYGAESAIASATPVDDGSYLTAPSRPQNLTAVGGEGKVVLTWDAPKYDGGAAIRDYKYRIDGKGRWISIGSTDTTYTVTGLDSGTVYTFQVRAVNSVGAGAASAASAGIAPGPEPEPLEVEIVGVPDVAVTGESYELTAQSDTDTLGYEWRVDGGSVVPNERADSPLDGAADCWGSVDSRGCHQGGRRDGSRFYV